MTEQAMLFWGLIVSMWIGNLMLLVLNLPLVGRLLLIDALGSRFRELRVKRDMACSVCAGRP